MLEISIYHNPDEDPAAENDWALMLRALRKERRLGITRFREIEIDYGDLGARGDLSPGRHRAQANGA